MKRSRKQAKADAAKKAGKTKVKFNTEKRSGPPRLLLIDADIFAYQAVGEKQVETRNADDEWTYTVSMAEVREAVELRIDELKRDLDAAEVLLCFGSEDNWRKRIMPEYKANRKDRKKPLGYKACVDWMMEAWPSKKIAQLEADDIIGYCMTDPDFAPDHEKIMVSEDKDFKSIPGKLYNPRHPDLGVQEISLQSANEFHMMQTLVGDSSDNYKGCPGVGEVKAALIINDEGRHADVPEMWDAVVAAFKQKNLTEDDALLNARVARILRKEDFNADGTRRLWTPRASRASASKEKVDASKKKKAK